MAVQVDAATPRSIFLAARYLPDDQTRKAYLDQVCGDDAQLRQRVDDLLAACLSGGLNPLEHLLVQLDNRPFSKEPASCLAAPSAAALSPTLAQPTIHKSGSQIGPYKIREELAEGGMGIVYVAEQSQPVRRKVALKVIKPGMSTKDVIARFEAERQALAMMDHPNIARVIDGGTTDSGLPFFVMELVQGVPITQYCDARRLAPAERLKLCVKVCQAVHHAHQKGIIHRDLKPSNVLVGEIDDEAVPKVIDFGIAKAINQKLSDHTVYTQFSQMVGTPLYMSPEQAGMGVIDIDTRSDVYSLGVMLYELLTGSAPFDGETLRRSGLDEMRRIICEQEPARPSRHVGTLGAEAVSTVADRRGLDPRKLSALLRGELDWIVMKCLEKDRTRRYGSASALADDLQRHLDNQPVEACPPSWRYRTHKFVARHRGPVIAAASLTALLVLGTIGTSVGFVQAVKAEQRALAAKSVESQLREVAEQQRNRARIAESQAKEEAAIAKAVHDFLDEDLLSQAVPENNARDKQVTVEQLLDRAAERLSGKFDQRPQVEAAIHRSIGNAYRSLGKLPPAQLHLERAVKLLSDLQGDDHLNLVQARNDLAGVYLEQGKYEQARSLFESVVEIRRRIQGDDSLDTLTAMNNLATVYSLQGDNTRAEPLAVQVLDSQRRLLGDDDPATLNAMNNLGALCLAERQFDRARPLFEQALKGIQRVLGNEHPNTLKIMNNLALTYLQQGDCDRAEPLLTRTVDVARRVFGPEHPDTIVSMGSLADVYARRKDYAQAEAKYTAVLDLRRRVLGVDHPHTIIALAKLAFVLSEETKYAEAEPLYAQLVEIQSRVFGKEHLDTLSSMEHLATALIGQGKKNEAIRMSVEALEIRRRVYGDEQPETLKAIHDLAQLYLVGGDPARAEPLYQAVLEARRQTLGNEHPDTLEIRQQLGATYWRLCQLDKSIPLFEELLRIYEKQCGPDNPITLASMNNLAFAYRSAKQFDKSAALYEECLQRRAATFGRDHLQTLETVADLGVTYQEAGRFKEAIPLLEEAQSAVKKHPRLGHVTQYLLVAYAKADENAKCTRLLQEIVEQYGPEHPTTLSTTEKLGVAYWEMRQLGKSIPLFESLLKIRVAQQGPDHPETLLTKVNLGINYREVGRLAEALVLLEAAQRDLKKFDAVDGTGILASCVLADMAANRGDYQLAEELLNEQLAAVRQCPGDQTYARLRIELGLANIAQARGDHEASAILHGALFERAQKELGDGHWLTLTAMNNLGYAQARGRNFAAAEKTLQETIARQVRALGEEHLNLLQTRTNLGELYQFQGDHARAEELLRQCLATRAKKEPNSFRLASTQSMLGRVLAEQKKYAEAEPLLLAGYKGLTQNVSTTPGWGKYYLPDTLDWLTQLYEALGNKDEAAKWQAERAKYPPTAPAATENK